MSDEPLNLIELRVLARRGGYTKITRNSRGAPVVNLYAWNGIESFGNPYLYVAVEYILRGNMVIVRKAGEPDVRFTLS